MKRVLVVDATIKRGQSTPILQDQDFEVNPYPSFRRMMTPAVNHPPDLVICVVRGEPMEKAMIKHLKSFPDTKDIPVLILLDEVVDSQASQYSSLVDVVLPLTVDEMELVKKVRMLLGEEAS